MTNTNNIIQIESAKFWTDAGILFCEISNSKVTGNLREETVGSYINAISKLCNGKKMPFLIDLRNTHGAFSSTAAKKLANSPELSKLSLGEAYVVNSLKINLLINSYKRIYEPIIPFKIFRDYNEALIYSIITENSANGII